MSFNTFGHLFRVTTWGESHGPALGCTVDGCPPGVAVDEAAIQHWLPGHADYTYFTKYGIRDYRGGGRSSARETAARVAAGGIARAVLGQMVPGLVIRGGMIQMGERRLGETRDWEQVSRNPFWCPDADAAVEWEGYLDGIRKDHDSVGAVIEIVATGAPAGLGAPIYAKLDTDLAAAMMSINAVKGVEIGDGFAAAALRGSDNADEMRMIDVVEWSVPVTSITEKGIYTVPVLRASGEEKQCYFDFWQYERFEDHEDGTVTMRLPRDELERRGVAHDTLTVVGRIPRFGSNHAGGILGGISSGQDLVVRFAVKPTSSILTPRKSIDRFGKEVDIVTKGRHDPCVGIRAVPVGEAMAACVILDHLLLHRGQVGENRGVLG